MSAEAGDAPGLAPKDPLARFIYTSSHFSRRNNRVKHNAFMPAADGKTSVYRTKELREAETWTIGEKVAGQRMQTLHARGDIAAEDVSKVKLRVVPSEPPPHHAPTSRIGLPRKARRSSRRWIWLRLPNW
jgi:hypothetical protein